MKWFQWTTDGHNNPKMKILLRKYGLEGYGLNAICREIIGKDGKNYRLKAEKEWKTTLQEASKLPIERLEDMLRFMGEKNIINPKALKSGDLYIPQMREHSDDYTKRVRRASEQSSLRIDKTRIDKIIKEYTTLRWGKDILKLPQKVIRDIYTRNTNPVKTLLDIAESDENALRAMRWTAQTCQHKGLTWRIETVLKQYPDWLIKFGSQLLDRTPGKVQGLVKKTAEEMGKE